MAKVLIQDGIKKYFEKEGHTFITDLKMNTDNFRDSLEKQSIQRLKGAPQRIRFYKKSDNKWLILR